MVVLLVHAGGRAKTRRIQGYHGELEMKKALRIHRIKALLFTLQEAYTQIEECVGGARAHLLLDRLQSEIDRLGARLRRLEGK
jgi:hypothetical protein